MHSNVIYRDGFLMMGLVCPALDWFRILESQNNAIQNNTYKLEYSHRLKSIETDTHLLKRS
jgi:hypothetical protein